MPEATVADVIAKYETLKSRAENYRDMLMNQHTLINEALADYTAIIADYEQEIQSLKNLQKDE